MHLKDFADWYAENTDADYDDIIKEVASLVMKVYQDAYYEGLGRGYKQGEEDTQERMSLDRDETIRNSRHTRQPEDFK